MTPVRYPVPWDLVCGLTPHILRGTRESLDAFTREVVSRMDPPPFIEGADSLPAEPRFVLVANHYQRKGLWILHTASAITQAIRTHYGAGDPPVRWIVTANWPPVRIGCWRLRNPGDVFLPRVAHALHGYPVAFAGGNPAYTARALRALLRDATQRERPIGLFPEGVAGTAGQLTEPLPGVDRLLRRLAVKGVPVVPVGVREHGRLVIRFGPVLPPEALLTAPDAAAATMEKVAQLVAG